jgi:hypothetical protein
MSVAVRAPSPSVTSPSTATTLPKIATTDMSRSATPAVMLALRIDQWATQRREAGVVGHWVVWYGRVSVRLPATLRHHDAVIGCRRDAGFSIQSTSSSPTTTTATNTNSASTFSATPRKHLAHDIVPAAVSISISPRNWLRRPVRRHHKQDSRPPTSAPEVPETMNGVLLSRIATGFASACGRTLVTTVMTRAERPECQ